ncbi:MAG: LamG domain-containing protein, partial [Bacteroidota bacterium]
MRLQFLFLFIAFLSFTQNTKAQIGVDIPATGDRVTFPFAGNPLYDLTEFTVEFWVNLDTYSSNYTIIQFYLPDVTTQVGGMGITSSGEMTVSLLNFFVTSTNSSTPTTISTGGWHHLAYVFNSGMWTFYFDGTQVGTPVPDAEGITAFPDYFTFGGGSQFDIVLGARPPILFSHPPLDGKLDEVRIWDIARTATQISDNKDTELIGSHPNLMSYWKLNETSGQIIIDSEPPGVSPTHNGFLGNSASNTTDDAVIGVTGIVLPPQAEFYVKTSPTGLGDGSDFDNAFGDLQDALTAAEPFGTGSKIYVAEGTYIPSVQYNFATGATITTDVRAASFKIPDGVEAYGGFDAAITGTVGVTEIAARDLIADVTILSGNIGSSATSTDNTYHVVFTKNVSSTTLIDGFTITEGNADGASPNSGGGGLYNDGNGIGNVSNPSLINCKFVENNATGSGGMWNNGRNGGNSSPTLTNCMFSQNTSQSNGGAIFNDGQFNGNSSPTFTNCVFFQNAARLNGGALSNIGNSGGNSSPTIINCTFSQNAAVLFNGGAIQNNASGGTSNVVIRNSIFWGNTSATGRLSWANAVASTDVAFTLIEEGSLPSGSTDSGNNILAQDPLFTDASA